MMIVPPVAGTLALLLGAGTDCLVDPDSVCQPPDHNAYIMGQPVAATSDRNGGYKVADDFTPDASGVISGATWWGLYIDFAGPFDCGPGDGSDAFRITYFHDLSGLPGPVLAGPMEVEVTKEVTDCIIYTGLGDVTEFEFTAAHAPVAVSELTTYWIEIVNATTGTCFWLWEASYSGDDLGYQAYEGDRYEPDDAMSMDAALCLDLVPGTCPGDIDLDGQVAVADLVALILAWGPCPGCPADLDGDGEVSVTDLVALLLAWGTCP